jgi:hypothetical protein
MCFSAAHERTGGSRRDVAGQRPCHSFDTPQARDLAELYQARWEIETALGSLKTQMKGAGIVLRSKTPTA